MQSFVVNFEPEPNTPTSFNPISSVYVLFQQDTPVGDAQWKDLIGKLMENGVLDQPSTVQAWRVSSASFERPLDVETLRKWYAPFIYEGKNVVVWQQGKPLMPGQASQI